MQQEYEYNVSGQPTNMVEDYFCLIRNLPDDDKIELIAKISDSILQNKRQKKQEQIKAKEEILAETYGSFESVKSADEIIEEIYNSRCFINKNHQL